jgi:hypothetical protein
MLVLTAASSGTYLFQADFLGNVSGHPSITSTGSGFASIDLNVTAGLWPINGTVILNLGDTISFSCVLSSGTGLVTVQLWN